MNDEKPNHGHCRPASCYLVVKVINIASENDSDDDVASGHADGAHNEHWLSADSVDVKHRGNGGELVTG